MSRSTTLAGPTSDLPASLSTTPAADPVKQRHAQLAFEGGDGLRQRGLGDYQLVRGLAESAVVDDREEERQLSDIHSRLPDQGE